MAICDNPVNESLIIIDNLKKVKYKACQAITGAMQGMSREILDKELGLESPQNRWRYKKVIFF